MSCALFSFSSIFNPRLFSSLAEHQMNFAAMLRSRGSVNGETSGNLVPAGRFPNNLAPAQSCRTTLASKSLTNDRMLRNTNARSARQTPKVAATYTYVYICIYVHIRIYLECLSHANAAAATAAMLSHRAISRRRQPNVEARALARHHRRGEITLMDPNQGLMWALWRRRRPCPSLTPPW